MLTKIILILAALLIAFAIVVALQPSAFRIERSLAISATSADIFPHLNDLKKAQAWSPWVKLDPTATYLFDGPPAGVGSSVAWAGNNQVGEGRQTIVESRPNELVRTRLDFKKPFESTSTGEFTLRSQAPGVTVVTWTMTGKNNFISKAFCLILNQDKMIGGPFEQGLASLKTLVETNRGT